MYSTTLPSLPLSVHKYKKYIQYIQTTASEHLKTQAGWKQTICLKRPQLTSVIELQDTTNHQFYSILSNVGPASQKPDQIDAKQFTPRFTR